MSSDFSISVIGAPIMFGQRRAGVDLGPAAIRHANLISTLVNLDYQVEDLGNIKITASPFAEQNTKLRNLSAINAVCESLAQVVDQIKAKGSFPLILGGDHSISIGSIAGIAKNHKRLGVIWYDAHGDLNTGDTSVSGNIHGMPLAACLGQGDKLLTHVLGFAPKVLPQDIVIIGARDLDPPEINLIKELNIAVYTAIDIERYGMLDIIERSLAQVSDQTDGVHLSLDLDALDSAFTPGVGTPVANGINLEDSLLAMRYLANSKKITSAEFVEVNPLLDDRNRTAEVAVALINALFQVRSEVDAVDNVV